MCARRPGGAALPRAMFISRALCPKWSFSMRQRFVVPVFAAVFTALFAGVGPSLAADDYVVDPAHSGVHFKIHHFELAWIVGRFNQFSGNFTIDKADPTKCSFNLDIKATSIDTNNEQRNNHLRTGDFFDVKQFPAIKFKSTGVKSITGGYEVTGDME